MNAPYFSSTALPVGSVPMCAARSLKLILPMTRPSGGMITSPTSEETILPKAAPITTPTARSRTLPFIANSLNSEPRLMTDPFVVDGERRAEQGTRTTKRAQTTQGVGPTRRSWRCGGAPIRCAGGSTTRCAPFPFTCSSYLPEQGIFSGSGLLLARALLRCGFFRGRGGFGRFRLRLCAPGFLLGRGGLLGSRRGRAVDELHQRHRR